MLKIHIPMREAGLLDNLLARYQFVHLSRSEDEDGKDYHFYGITEDGERRSCSHDSPEAMIAFITGRLPRKKCALCCKQKPLAEYPPVASSSDGYGPRCKTCDRIRCDLRRRKRVIAREELTSQSAGCESTRPRSGG